MVNKLLYAVGGHDGPLVRKSVEVYNPETNSWSQTADMNVCRRNAGGSHQSKMSVKFNAGILHIFPLQLCFGNVTVFLYGFFLELCLSLIGYICKSAPV